MAEGSDGRLHRSLVSLPCRIFGSTACLTPDSTGVIKVDPPWKVKAKKAASLALVQKNRLGLGGTLSLSSNIPVGLGLGSSTSDVTAAIRASADALDESFSAAEIALLAVTAEVASDPIMFNGNAVLFAQREGVVIEDLGGSAPDLEVLGFNIDPARGGIDTLSFAQARYSCWEVEAFRPLIGLLRRAVGSRDASLVGRIASASARINQRFLRKPHLDCLESIVKQVGAVGFQVAHSGTIAGLLFDPSCSRLDIRVRQAQAMLKEMGLGETWRFRSGY